MTALELDTDRRQPGTVTVRRGRFQVFPDRDDITAALDQLIHSTSGKTALSDRHGAILFVDESEALSIASWWTGWHGEWCEECHADRAWLDSGTCRGCTTSLGAAENEQAGGAS